MILVCGIQSTKKDYFCEQMSKQIMVSCYSIDELINRKNNFILEDSTYTEKKYRNLIESIKMIQHQQANFIVDVQLCQFNALMKFEKISKKVLYDMNISSLVVIVDDIERLKEEISGRYNICLDYQFVEMMQEMEIAYATEIAEKLNIGLQIKKNFNNKRIFLQDIVLPIKPKYSEKIFSGEKIYEYRKILCKKNVDKIYIYETLPIKKIVGEAYLLEKIRMEKQQLWDMTRTYSGITKEYFESYFRNHQMACAYKLGYVTKYKNELKLKDLGVDSVPQSFIYTTFDGELPDYNGLIN